MRKSLAVCCAVLAGAMVPGCALVTYWWPDLGVVGLLVFALGMVAVVFGLATYAVLGGGDL